MKGDDAVDAYVAIANEIIVSAAEDYKRALMQLKRNPGNVHAKKSARRLENYFHSSEFEIMTKLNPDYLIKKMKKYVDELYEKGEIE